MQSLNKITTGLRALIFYILLILSWYSFAHVSENKQTLYSGISEVYQHHVAKTLELSQGNRAQLVDALQQVPLAHKNAMAFLIAYMPVQDAVNITAQELLDNVAWAYKAKETFPWGKDIPENIFFNDVLPYRSLDEVRDNWRAHFYNLFKQFAVKDTSMLSVFLNVKEHIRDVVGVSYNTEREKANQNATESMRQGKASCTGLAILLNDALRALCIPTRLVGNYNWYDDRGNHTWNEVWVHSAWLVCEYTTPKGYNDTWFIESAGKANPKDLEHAILAVSYRITKIPYTPILLWDDQKPIMVHAINVTDQYIKLAHQKYHDQVASNNYASVSIIALKKVGDSLTNKNRASISIDIFDEQGKQLGGGLTADSSKDLNNTFNMLLPKNKKLTAYYVTPDGRENTYHFHTNNKATQVIYFSINDKN
ncbi:MAG: transglutaminase-like domain-containing protein [Phycisphaerales bacterium]|nr:transglutaminase-like domain-containing protein [Phycisphaerales bacterium]